MKLAYR